MPRRRTSRIRWRKRGKGPARAYGDFRDFQDVGGGEEALIPKDGKGATTDELVAQALVTRRLEELQERRRNKTVLGIERQAALKEFAARHLTAKAKSGKFSESWLDQAQRHLTAAVEFFGTDRDLATIAVSDARHYRDWLAEQPNGRDGRCPDCGRQPSAVRKLEASCSKCGTKWRVGTLSGGTQRHYLNSLSNLYRRAAAEGYVQPGYNPVAALLEKPTPQRKEAEWLEAHDAALFLEAARLHRPERPDVAMPYLYPLIATFLLTGGRQAEVLGLEVDDVSFDRHTITFRPNQWRRLKTSTSHRTVPMWPQLEAILREYVFGSDGPPGRLLFPSSRASKEAILTDIRRALDSLAESAGWKAGEIRTKAFRHTYCAARLQTLDRGAPVSPWTVANEMGHGGRSLVDRVYGHLGNVRHRSEVVEFEADQHADELGPRLGELRAKAQQPAPERCKGTTSGGERCKVQVNLSAEGFCLWHDPERREAAKAARPHAAREANA